MNAPTAAPVAPGGRRLARPKSAPSFSKIFLGPAPRFWPTRAVASKKSAPYAVTDRELSRWRLVEDFKARLKTAAAQRPLAATWSHPERRLAYTDYLSLFLLGLLNPVVRTMRGLCAASHLARVQAEVCARPVSLGSFSEAQAVLDPVLLADVFGQLSREVCGGPGADPGTHRRWLIQDGSLFAALPRMYWALWRRQGPAQCQVRLHLSLDLAHAAPARAVITPGKVCERAA